MKATTQSRKLMREEETVIAAGCYDALTARFGELAGFKAMYISGMCVEAALLGAPDMGFITMTELTQHAAHIAQAVNVPVLCDSDDGWGSVQAVSRAVREWERAGIAGIHLED